MSAIMRYRCDARGCQEEEPIQQQGETPEGWVRIKLERARQGISYPTGHYAFHSQECLIVWAGGFVR